MHFSSSAVGAVKPPKPGTLVLIDWLDASSDHGWQPSADVKNKPDPVRSVGWVLKHDKHAITLAADGLKRKPHKHDVNRTITIPLGMVSRIWRIKL